MAQHAAIALGCLPGGSRRAPPRVARRGRSRVPCAAGRSAEPDVAIFRFTLGSEWVEDSQVPRLLGVLSLGLLAANHVLAGADGLAPQSRTEALAALVALFSTLLPWVERQLEADSAAEGLVEAAATQQSVFLLADGLDEAARQELAWSSFVLLSNTKSVTCMLWRAGALECVRGRLGKGLAADLALLAPTLIPLLAQPRGDGPSSMERADAERLFGSGGGSLLVLPRLHSDAYLVLFSPLADAFSAKTTRWAQAFAEKP